MLMKRFIIIFSSFALASVVSWCWYLHFHKTSRGNYLWWFIEGLYAPLDYRDVGESLNACAGPGQDYFLPGVLTRSNRYFSGHSCAAIGNPDRIYTLSYEP